LLCRFARGLSLHGDAATAVRLISCWAVLFEEMGGVVVEPWLAEMNEETLAMTRRTLDEESSSEAWDQGRSLSADEAVALALESLSNA
jgi:hypothetical protein